MKILKQIGLAHIKALGEGRGQHCATYTERQRAREWKAERHVFFLESEAQ